LIYDSRDFRETQFLYLMASLSDLFAFLLDEHDDFTCSCEWLKVFVWDIFATFLWLSSGFDGFDLLGRLLVRGQVGFC
jgi:hypothetical protein